MTIAYKLRGDAAASLVVFNIEKQARSVPTDPLFVNQWHLDNTGQSGGTAGVDLNVTEVWEDYTGTGITVAVYDDGLQHSHHDLNDNYDVSQQITVGGNLNDPDPTSAGANHGTAVAGLIAAENNGTGTVGVAYDSTLVGVDIFRYASQSADEAEAMQHQDDFDVVNHSWGYGPFFVNQLEAGWAGFMQGFADGAEFGRGGLGTIMVIAGGNDRYNRDTNDDSMLNSRYTIGVGAVDHTGDVSSYSTPGAALLIAATTNEISPAGGGVWTTDRTGADGYSDGTNESGNSDADYTAEFGGTSAASPMVAGVVALMLEANPNLGWRDVQQILANTAVHTGSAIGSGASGDEFYDWGWNASETWNGGGMHFSNDYGFGLVDALAAVRLAESWAPQSTSANESAATGMWTGNVAIPDDDPGGISFTFDVATDINIEYIEIEFQLTHTYMGDLLITLTSPDGTVSTLIDFNINRDNPFPTAGWTFGSNMFRGEDSAGTWTVDISDNFEFDTGSVSSADFTAYGASNLNDDMYVYTDEYATYAGVDGHSTTFSDTSGNDTINAAAVTTGSNINLNTGVAGSVAGQALTISSGTIENAYGGDGDDTITGNNAANTLSGGRGMDNISGGLGNDIIDGGDGDDVLNGGFHDDILMGGAGDDSLEGGHGDDTIDGGDGVDTGLYDIFGGAVIINLNITTQQDTNAGGLETISNIENLTGGIGNDQFTGTTGDNVLIGFAGSDKLFGLGGDDTLRGGDLNDNLQGGNGTDQLEGGDGIDTLLGGAGVDTLLGEDGNDQLRGGDGADFLFGGLGRDVLIGGDFVGGMFPGDGDTDTFTFLDIAESGVAGATRDIIRDFEVDIDLIDVGDIDANQVGGTANDTFTFIGTAGFSGLGAASAGELRFFNTGANTIVDADVDGDGASDFRVFMNGVLALDADDFIL